MPNLSLSTPTGDINLHYHIATPISPSSPDIVANLPSIIFIHGEYACQEVFEAQFSDPRLRNRFNLISIDLRGCGASGGVVSKSHTPAIAANDLHLFLEKLKIPGVHVFSLSIGGHVALEWAHAHPEDVLSLTLCSPLSPEEPEDVKAGRLEVFDFWHDSSAHEGGTPDCEADLDEELISPMVRGCQQMMFSEHANPLTEAVTMTALTHASINWAGSPEILVSCRTICIDWFIERKVFNVEFYAKIKCPITIIHCEEDIGYPLRYAQEFEALLREAGHTEVLLCQVPGPHFANVVYPQLINPILSDRVLSVATPNAGDREEALSEGSEGGHNALLTTPFKEALAQYGYHSDSDEWDSE
ncbi:hypothetical protein D9615_005060 [Tricholomella constricta]|uniref:AB hydrolase-1 domain-containing protein n=1 Tax=Tricholomella constricta TaxID=117010 RepID=A0A8H5M6Q1_9AGAR|nr:hypothetical protein D9615_005060 [Tricholomella constricta]